MRLPISVNTRVAAGGNEECACFVGAADYFFKPATFGSIPNSDAAWHNGGDATFFDVA
jgi:hypothetical protein